MEAYAAQKELPKGTARLKEIVASHPGSAALQTLLGEWYLRVGNSVEAKPAYEAAAVADHSFLPAELSLAQMEIVAGRNDAARQKLNAVLAADPKNVSALLLSAGAGEAMGAHSDVISTYRTVLNIDSSNLFALNNLAYALAVDNPDEALKFAQEAVEIAPDNPTVQDTLAWVYYRKGLYSMAARFLKTALDKEATPQRQFHLGMTYLKMGDEATGQRMVRAALVKDPGLAKTEQGW